MTPKKRSLKFVFAIFWEKTQNLKIRAYLMQNFMELNMKKNSDPKTLTFGSGA